MTPEERGFLECGESMGNFIPNALLTYKHNPLFKMVALLGLFMKWSMLL